tara:strand:- start:495 stop:752 length:258 start_codon:yes stop_codon:yes gene_type:complete
LPEVHTTDLLVLSPGNIKLYGFLDIEFKYGAKSSQNFRVDLAQDVLDVPMVIESDPEEHFVIEAATKLFTFAWFVFELSIFAETI